VSQSDQPGGPGFFPPFSEELNVDEKLELSNENFKQTIYDFFQDLIFTPLSQLTATPFFPTPHVLAQFASKAYTDYEKGETDAQYETRLALPDGWKLLTTASNFSKTNGYFGAAYWHPEHQQLVIAHRGTDPTNLGALWTDLKGVVHNKYVGQMESASTFAHNVVEVLREVNRKKGVSFQLFFTGHSLGGWLAQITTFTTEYLKRDGKIFFQNNEEQDCFHPHTVVFDSPGCKNILLKMIDKLDVRLEGRTIELEHLDITSYLSAPNRINTCNKHVGTVYRIFTDYSDMGWQQKHTALYNLATHSMDKIVAAFDPQTGQVYKDEQNLLKVQVLVDWPVSAGLSGGEEYKRFFQWADHLNNYHPDIKDLSFQHMHYYPIRYQTKLHDERVNSLSVFSEKEQEFLQCYSWLRQWPEFFKPKELFSAMKNDQAQDEAEKILQNFEIEKDKIRCTDGSALQALIPYVKRLLQVFPQIKEKTNHALSPDEVRNRVYRFETRRYVERISQSPLEFKADASSLREFLVGEQQQVLHLQMVKGDEWTGLIKVHQVLQVTGCFSEGQYTILKLKRLLQVNKLMDLGKMMLSAGTPYLLLIACEDNKQLDEETKDVIRNLFETIKQKPNIKIIFITQSGCSSFAFLHHMCRRISGKGFVSRDEQLTWSDLTASSQEKLLEKSVKFQGAKISLNEIMSADSPVANLLPLGALLKEEELKIADPVPIINGYNESYYIRRTFRHQKVIKEDILISAYVKFFADSIANTEQEFKQLCQLNPKRNVHWLEKDKREKHVWRQSQGSLQTLRKYIDTDSSHTYTADDLDTLLEQAQHQRVMLISDTAGMGKSTVLTHLSMQIKQKFPAKWVVRIDLNDHTNALKALKQKQIDKKKAIEFVSEKLLKLETGLELELFKKCCEQKQKVGIVIMLDGFDEISPNYKENVLAILEALRQTAVEQLWVTTRPHLREELENKLQQLSYTLKPFSKEDEVEFLTKFWSLQEWFTEPVYKEEDAVKSKLQIYAEKLTKKLSNSISDRDRLFTGIPLLTRMLAEAFDEDVRTFCQSSKCMPELPFQLDLLELYGRFIERKYDIYQEEKLQVRLSNVAGIGLRERDLKTVREEHQLLALKVLFTEEQLTLLESNCHCSFSKEELTRIGIAQVTYEGAPHFIHRTFAEYFVAEYLVNRLTKGDNTSEQEQNFILKDIFLKEDYRVIRIFVDGLMSNSKPPNEVLKQYGNRTCALGEDAGVILHRAVREGNANIAGILLDSGQAAEHTDTVNKLLLAQDEGRKTAWHLAALGGNMQLLELLQNWAKEKLKREEINNKLLLAKDKRGRTAWHVAAEDGKLDILQKVWELANENLIAEEISNKLLLATDMFGKTAWQKALDRGDLDLIKEMWEEAKENVSTEELKNLMLLATDGEGKTAWHMAGEKSKLDLLEKAWEWAKEKLTRKDTKNIFFTNKDSYGRAVWKTAAWNGNIEFSEKLWEWANENLTKEEIRSKLLLARDKQGDTAWVHAAKWGKKDALEKLWAWAKKNVSTEELKNKLLLATDSRGWTACHRAARKGKIGTLQKIWELVKKNQTTEDLEPTLLLAKDKEGRTAWHVAAERYKLDKIWEWAKENVSNEELKKRLLLATDSSGRTGWHVAVMWGGKDISQKIWAWTKENVSTEELKNKLLLATDRWGGTGWHMAALWKREDVMQKVWEWAKENVSTEELKNKLLLATDGEGRTGWHVTVMGGGKDISQKIWEWAKENVSTEELKNKLLLATDREGRTGWHAAVMRGGKDISLKIWEWAKENVSTEELKNKLLLATDNEGRTGWHVTVMWGEKDVSQKIWEWAKENVSTEELKNKLLLATNSKGKTVWHVAVEGGGKDVLQKIWEWAKENVSTEELINKLLLATNSEGRIVWHVAVEGGGKDVLQIIWEWVKENVSTEELKNKLLLATDSEGRTGWHVAVMWGGKDISQKIWEWAKENVSTEELKNKLLLATNSKGRIVWHVAVHGGGIDVLQKIWEWAKENVSTEELKNKLLLATDSEGRTGWHMAATLNREDVIQKIWELAKENVSTEELKNKLLLATDSRRRTGWHVAVMWGTEDLSQKIWEWAKENVSKEELINKLLLATDSEGETGWHIVADWGGRNLKQKVWEWAKENVSKHELKINFINHTG